MTNQNARNMGSNKTHSIHHTEILTPMTAHKTGVSLLKKLIEDKTTLSRISDEASIVSAMPKTAP